MRSNKTQAFGPFGYNKPGHAQAKKANEENDQVNNDDLFASHDSTPTNLTDILIRYENFYQERLNKSLRQIIENFQELPLNCKKDITSAQEIATLMLASNFVSVSPSNINDLDFTQALRFGNLFCLTNVSSKYTALLYQHPKTGKLYLLGETDISYFHIGRPSHKLSLEFILPNGFSINFPIYSSLQPLQRHLLPQELKVELLELQNHITRLSYSRNLKNHEIKQLIDRIQTIFNKVYQKPTRSILNNDKVNFNKQPHKPSNLVVRSLLTEIAKHCKG